MRPDKPVVVITGASAGIGEATAQILAQQNAYRLVLGARRTARVEALARCLEEQTGTEALGLYLDVSQAESVQQAMERAQQRFGGLHILVNNAGLAVGRDPLLETSENAWKTMLSVNVEGVLAMTRAAVPLMLQAGWGHVVMVGSIAGHDAYAGGGVYCATKHAVRAIAKALRQELCGKPVRITSVDPGMVYTEFSQVRLGSKEAGDAVYAGMEPLTAHDVAECIRWSLSLPDRVNIDEIIVQPRDQANLFQVARSRVESS